MPAYPERLTDRNYTNKGLNISRRKTNAPYHLHWHEFYEIEIFIDGSLEFTVNGKTFTVRGGDITIVSPVDFHSMRPIDGGCAEYYNIMISEECISDTFSAVLNRLSLAMTTHPSDDDFKTVLTLCEILEKSHDRAFETHYAKNLLECIIINAATGTENTDEFKDDSIHTIRSALNYIHENFTKKLTLSDIAAQCGYSESYISRKFHIFTGKTFGEYLAETRCRHAKMLIASTDMSMYDICFYSGFTSFSQFSRCFKKCCGIPPASFRKPEYKE